MQWKSFCRINKGVRISHFKDPCYYTKRQICFSTEAFCKCVVDQYDIGPAVHCDVSGWTLGVYYGVVPVPGDNGSPQGREAPVGRSVSG